MSKRRIAATAVLVVICVISWVSIYRKQAVPSSKVRHAEVGDSIPSRNQIQGAPTLGAARSVRFAKLDVVPMSSPKPGKYEQLRSEALPALLSRIPIINLATSRNEELAAEAVELAGAICQALAFEDYGNPRLKSVSVVTYPDGSDFTLADSFRQDQAKSPNFCWETLNVSASCIYICDINPESLKVVPFSDSLMSQYPELAGEAGNHYLVLELQVGHFMKGQNLFQFEFIHDSTSGKLRLNNTVLSNKLSMR